MRIEPQAAFERRGGIDPSDAMEIAGMAFHNRVMQGFDQLARENPDRFVTIDTTKSVDEVFQKIVSTFDSRWKRRKKEG
jgi:dTMP kinase